MKILQLFKVLGLLSCLLSQACVAFVDSDRDGLPDEWEQHFGLDPFDKTDAKIDADEDGFTPLNEFMHGGSPISADTGRLPDYYIYADGLLNEWADKSPTPAWQIHPNISGEVADQVAADLKSTGAVYHGNYALAMVPERWRFLNLIHSNIDLGFYDNLEFYIHGGDTGGQVLKIVLQGSTYSDSPQYKDVYVNDYIEGGSVVANEWRKVSIPMADLLGDIAVVSSINLGWPSTGLQTLYYIDEMKFTAPAGKRNKMTITVDADMVTGEFNRDLLGSNGAYWSHNMNNDALVDRVVHSGINSVRYPGGNVSDSFHWQDWLNVSDDSLLTTPDEFFSFLANSASQGVITTNFGTGTAQEAADWVSYAQEQGADIAMWEVGNEIYGSWQPTWTHKGDEYMNGANGLAGAKDYCAQMKAVNPDIKVSMVGTKSASQYNGFGPKAIANANDCFDYYSMHYYAQQPGKIDYHALLNNAHADIPVVSRNVKTMLAANPATANVEIALTEYNSYSANPEILASQAVNMLYIADVIGQAALSGIKRANHWFLGSVASDTHYYDLLTDYTDYKRSPNYYVFPLWNKMGDQLVQVSTNKSAANEIAVYASKHSDTGEISLLVINKTPKRQKAMLDLGQFNPQAQVAVFEAKARGGLKGTKVKYNGEKKPTDMLAFVPPMMVELNTAKLNYKFKPYSVTVVRFTPES